jgi:AcrR family transcriptional regulator
LEALGFLDDNMNKSIPDAPESSSKQIEILDAAAATFMNLGFAATSVDAVADTLGVTKGFVYYYYKSKTELFFAVQMRALEITRDSLEPLAKTREPPSRRLFNMAHAHTLLILSQLSYLRVAAQGVELHLLKRTTPEERIALDSIIKLRDYSEQLYVRVIEEGVKLKQFRCEEPKMIVKPLLGAINWTSRWYHPRRGETISDRKQIADAIATFIVNGVLPAQ